MMDSKVADLTVKVVEFDTAALSAPVRADSAPSLSNAALIAQKNAPILAYDTV
jgi:hypothetical protein